jgi:hypothetical protein
LGEAAAAAAAAVAAAAAAYSEGHTHDHQHEQPHRAGAASQPVEHFLRAIRPELSQARVRLLRWMHVRACVRASGVRLRADKLCGACCDVMLLFPLSDRRRGRCAA